jgi:hypothetical protein
MLTSSLVPSTIDAADFNIAHRHLLILLERSIHLQEKRIRRSLNSDNSLSAVG